nr:hypothetical transcript [Hymenolepis microstoma]
MNLSGVVADRKRKRTSAPLLTLSLQNPQKGLFLGKDSKPKVTPKQRAQLKDQKRVRKSILEFGEIGDVIDLPLGVQIDRRMHPE